jgi:hypothetical protein
MDSEQKVRFEVSKTNNEHGLCDAAETHWAIYLIQAIRLNLRPTLEVALQDDGKEITLMKKGGDGRITGYTFGADSYIILGPDDSELNHMLVVQEDPDMYIGRPLKSLAESLEINGFFDKDITSRWKDLVAAFAKFRGVSANELSLNDLLEEALAIEEV